MERALELAQAAGRLGEVPVGAVVLDSSSTLVGEGSNARVGRSDPTAHAEVEALRAAGARLGSSRLVGCTLVVTLEPCAMCAGAAVAARLRRVVFGAWDEKAGACGSVWDLTRDRMSLHVVEVVPGVYADRAADQLRDFFAARR
jgi:tRNA(adenine34) deaminase